MNALWCTPLYLARNADDGAVAILVMTYLETLAFLQLPEAFLGSRAR